MNERFDRTYYAGKQIDLRELDISDDDVGVLRHKLDEPGEAATSLLLSGNRISGAGVAALLGAERVRHTLEKLALDDNELGNDGIEALCAWLAAQPLPSLRALCLAGTRMGPDALPFLAPLLSGVDVLQLDRNRLRDLDASLPRALGAPTCTLRYVSLGKTLLSPASVAALLHSLASNTSVTYLNLDEVAVVGPAVAALAAMLRSNSTLQSLLLSQSRLRVTAELGAALAANSTLSELDVTSNKLDDEQAEWLASGLADNGALRRLDMASNHVGDRGAAALGRMLRSNSCLAVLMFDRNRFGPDGCQALAAALEHNRTLRTLTVNTNGRIGGAGVQALFTSLQRNDGLQVLNVCGTGMTGGQCPALAELLLRHAHLHTLHMSSNDVGDDIAALAEPLRRNTALTTFVATDIGASLPVLRDLQAHVFDGNATLERLVVASTPLQHEFNARNTLNNKRRYTPLLSLLLSL